MEINKTYVAYFSPTFSTRDVVRKIGKKINKNYHEFDLTSFDNSISTHEFHSDELLVIGAPVFGGRIPEVAIERIKNLKGNNTPCLIIVTYGNREYDDALIELKETMVKCGFKVIGATCIICKHSIVNEIATNRPSKNDYHSIFAFAETILDKLEKIKDISKEDIYVPGNSDYKDYKRTPGKYRLNTKLCNKCGLCAEMCPVRAIDFQNPAKVNNDKCFACMRCIKVCPSAAREYNKTKHQVLRIYLRNHCDKNRKNEFYF